MDASKGHPTVEVEIKKLDEDVIIPSYATDGSSGFDLMAHIPFNNGEIMLEPIQSSFGNIGFIIRTGLSVAIPLGYELQIRSRSGLAKNYHIVVTNSPGTIDADYRGEICVLLSNHGKQPFVVHDKMKIAQAVLCPVVTAKFKEVQTLSSTDRGSGGFGSTGL